MTDLFELVQLSGYRNSCIPINAKGCIIIAYYSIMLFVCPSFGYLQTVDVAFDMKVNKARTVGDFFGYRSQYMIIIDTYCACEGLI